MLWKLKAVSQIGFNELVQPLQAVRTNLSICNNIKIKDLNFLFTSFNFVITFIIVT